MKKAATFYCRGFEAGASDGSRTRDLMITSQVLYQLSYAGNNYLNIHVERKNATAATEKINERGEQCESNVRWNNCKSACIRCKMAIIPYIM